MTSRRNQPHNVKQAAPQAAQLVQPRTCEGCAHLRSLRPMCMAETSPHYRQPRESFNAQCSSFARVGLNVKQAVRA